MENGKVQPNAALKRSDMMIEFRNTLEYAEMNGKNSADSHETLFLMQHKRAETLQGAPLHKTDGLVRNPT